MKYLTWIENQTKHPIVINCYNQDDFDNLQMEYIFRYINPITNS